MRIRISMTVERDPIELAPSGDLQEVIDRVEEDPTYVAWLLQAPISSFNIEAVD